MRVLVRGYPHKIYALRITWLSWSKGITEGQECNFSSTETSSFTSMLATWNTNREGQEHLAKALEIMPFKYCGKNWACLLPSRKRIKRKWVFHGRKEMETMSCISKETYFSSVESFSYSEWIEWWAALWHCQFSGPEDSQGDMMYFCFSGCCTTGSITGMNFWTRCPPPKLVQLLRFLIYKSECSTATYC